MYKYVIIFPLKMFYLFKRMTRFLTQVFLGQEPELSLDRKKKNNLSEVSGMHVSLSIVQNDPINIINTLL